MTNRSQPQTQTPGPGRPSSVPDQSPAEGPHPSATTRVPDSNGRWPPDSLPNPMPGLDPQQTPGIDRLGEAGERQRAWMRAGREL
ncbi:hypothetical protein [Achromobacter sp. Marseille-Q4962]|uniref:hypothetical protein n=1 Tax=Achromobacter sp. Marseille-Q4962 TaxID=2942202 RepID=UPI002072AEA5|nr:hypothetical protein [Achromobacter sp. Marseille-Q4962]